MWPTQKAITLIQKFESCSLKRYKCPAGVWTIGWGNTRHAKDHETCSQSQADQWLVQDMAAAADAINLLIENTPLNSNQYDALVSFVFNVGAGNFKKSTMLKKILLCDFDGAAAEFGKWVKGGGKTLPGLVRRRAEERILFESKSE